MSEKDEGLLKSSVSRREFLKIAGVAGATIGAGRRPWRPARRLRQQHHDHDRRCGDHHQPAPPRPPATTTTGAAGATTTVSASAEVGREVKIGFVTPQTGPLGLVRRAGQVLRRPGHRSYRRRRRLRRRQEAPGHDHHPGQPVRLQPGRAGDRRPDQQREGRHHHRGLHAGHRRSRGRHGRRPTAPRASPTTARGSRTLAAARRAI